MNKKIEKMENTHLRELIKKYTTKPITELYNLYDKLEYELTNKQLEHDTIGDIIERYKKQKTCYSLNTIEGKLLQQKALKISVNNKDVELKGPYKGYPSYNNKNFSNEISNKYEFRPIITTNKNCTTINFEKQPHQLFLRNFISNTTPYKSILINHGTGSGKTCTGISIAENFRDTYANEHKRIIILASKNIIENWKNTIFNPLKGNDQCTNDTFIKIVKSTMKGINHEKVTNKQVSRIIKKYYEFYGYQKFSNEVKKIMNTYSRNETGEKAITLRHKAITDYFSNRIIIVDEVHNIRNNSEYNEKDIITTLTLIATLTKDLRLILLTATPMYNTASEILWILNLMLLNDNREIINENDIFDNDRITTKGAEVLLRKCRGYISYIRGENPYTYPIRLYPHDNKDVNSIVTYPRRDIFNNPIKTPIKFLKLFGCKIDGYQKLINNKRVAQLTKNKHTFKIDQETELMQLSNIVYPGKLKQPINELYGERGFLNTFELVGTRKVGGYKYKEGKIHFLEKSHLHKFSSKLNELLKRIQNSKGIIYIYSQYIWSGILPLILALEQNGYKKYSGESIFKHPEWAVNKSKCKYEPISYNGELYSDYIQHGNTSNFQQGKYIVLTGDQMLSKNNTEEIKRLNDLNNKHGENIKIVIGNVVSAEGIDFKRIREIHILDPWHHLNRLEQIIGRGIRYCSHDELEDIDNYSLKNVTVYMYIGYINEIESIDTYIYRHAEYKAINIGKVELLLKKNAIDCSLFYSTNVLGGDIRNINIISSQGVTINNYKPKDIEYSKICSFSKECKYDCRSPKKLELNYDTINKTSINYLSESINKYIQELFLFKHNYLLNEIIDYIDQYIDVDEQLIYFSLTNMVNNKAIIIDSNKNQGYIIYRANNYIFQPVNIPNENLSLYDRSNSNINPKQYIQLQMNYNYNPINTLPISTPLEVYDKITNTMNSVKVLELLQKNIYKPLITPYILIQYSVDRLFTEDKFTLIHDLYNKVFLKKEKLNESEEIIFNYIKPNFIYKIRNKYYVLDNTNITDKPIGMYSVRKKDAIYMFFNEDSYSEANEIQTNKIKEYITTYQSKNVFQNKYIKLPKIWGYGFKRYIGNEESLDLKISITNGKKKYEGIVCQNPSQHEAGDKSQNIKHIETYFKKYFSNELYSSGTMYSKKNICKLLELILRKETNKEKYYITYDSIYLKYY